MTIRLQEIHPTLVHYPLAFLPLSILADLLGRATGSKALMETGRRTMPLAAVSAALTGAAGLIAQESVRTTPRSAELLHTHRTLNASLIALGTAMAVRRLRSEQPGVGYLLAGLAALGAMTYSAYLGGKMVYEHGLGVRSAHGLQDERAPEIRPGNLRETGRLSARHVAEGAWHAVRGMASGELMPLLRRTPAERHAATSQSAAS